MVFHSCTQACIVSQYWLLILNGHESHEIPEFDHFCTEHLIIVLCMSPHSSHLLQSLDIDYFAPLKRLYRKQVEANIQLEINYINKLKFLALYNIACMEVSRSSVTCHFGIKPCLNSMLALDLSVQHCAFWPRWFGKASTRSWQEALNANNIHQEFVVTGLVPYNPD